MNEGLTNKQLKELEELFIKANLTQKEYILKEQLLKFSLQKNL